MTMAVFSSRTNRLHHLVVSPLAARTLCELWTKRHFFFGALLNIHENARATTTEIPRNTAPNHLFSPPLDCRTHSQPHHHPRLSSARIAGIADSESQPVRSGCYSQVDAPTLARSVPVDIFALELPKQGGRRGVRRVGRRAVSKEVRASHGPTGPPTGATPPRPR